MAVLARRSWTCSLSLSLRSIAKRQPFGMLSQVQIQLHRGVETPWCKHGLIRFSFPLVPSLRVVRRNINTSFANRRIYAEVCIQHHKTAILLCHVHMQDKSDRVFRTRARARRVDDEVPPVHVQEMPGMHRVRNRAKLPSHLHDCSQQGTARMAV